MKTNKVYQDALLNLDLDSSSTPKACATRWVKFAHKVEDPQLRELSLCIGKLNGLWLTRGGSYFEPHFVGNFRIANNTHIREALKHYTEQLRSYSNKALSMNIPEWQVAALNNGWTPPQGWTPPKGVK